eukprot:TRINITY_DN4148_c0_g1_i1.p3 TRINITY_DN4148_c0_g1~~TRINITY_DN4148_c0_g1_i1.p3  ORF type:complete len:50 (-),score=1.31 TRINITY_DN4148_c0_g1_i1:61-210(-)
MTFDTRTKSETNSVDNGATTWTVLRGTLQEAYNHPTVDSEGHNDVHYST